MKGYEAVETGRRLDTTLPIYARIDGRSFSSFTRGMKRPFDERMSRAMIEATKLVVERTHAKIGYTQSDEISLVFMAEEGSDVFFNGRVQKLVSVLASITSIGFLNIIRNTPGLEHYVERYPHFDARVFQLPSVSEAANTFLWRERDASKNAISMAARAHYSSSALHKKNQKDMREMLLAKGVDFDSYPDFFKRGTWVRRVVTPHVMTEEECATIPPHHRPPVGHIIQRSEVKEINMPDFNLVTNRVGVIFNREDPVTGDSA